MVKLTQLILHIGDEMNVAQKRYGYGQANIIFRLMRVRWALLLPFSNIDSIASIKIN